MRKVLVTLAASLFFFARVLSADAATSILGFHQGVWDSPGGGVETLAVTLPFTPAPHNVVTFIALVASPGSVTGVTVGGFNATFFEDTTFSIYFVACEVPSGSANVNITLTGSGGWTGYAIAGVGGASQNLGASDYTITVTGATTGAINVADGGSVMALVGDGASGTSTLGISGITQRGVQYLNPAGTNTELNGSDSFATAQTVTVGMSGAVFPEILLWRLTAAALGGTRRTLTGAGN